jgi:branched-chain amino acid transport system substrate-binding protein
MVNKSNVLSAPTRRHVLKVATGAAGTLAFDARFARVFAQSSGPIRIGVFNTFTKAAALYGEATWRGIDLYLDGTGRTLAGRNVELIKEDDEFNPQVGLQKLRKLVESDKVHAVLGPLGSHIAAAMAAYMKSSGTPWIVTGAGSTALTKERIPAMYRASLTNWQVAHPMGTWAYHHAAKEAVTVCSDFLAGHDISHAFKETFTKEGGKILKEIFPPVGTNDFSAYLADIRSASAPAVYGFFTGSEAGRFVRQFQQYGLKGRVKLLGFQSTLDSDTFPLQGNSAIGGLSSSIYCETLDTPENKAFVDLYEKKHKDLPGIFSESGYTAMRILDDAAKTIGGRVEDIPAWSAAIGKTNIKAPRGPVSFDPVTHQAIQNVYIREVIEDKGRIVNKLLDTVLNVGDFPGNKS